MKKVLIAEDDRDVQEVYAHLFEVEGVRILQAFNTDDAARLLAANPDIDAAIMDGIMPGRMNVLTLIRELRQKMKEAPILATSSNGDLCTEMVLAGCSQKSTKHDAPFLILDMLK